MREDPPDKQTNGDEGDSKSRLNVKKLLARAGGIGGLISLVVIVALEDSDKLALYLEQTAHDPNAIYAVAGYAVRVVVLCVASAVCCRCFVLSVLYEYRQSANRP